MLLFVSFLLLTSSIYAADDPVGHNQPLGSHMKPLPVEETYSDISPFTFYNTYVSKNRPILMKGLAARHWSNTLQWTDEKMVELFGDLRFECEEGKKEDRSKPARTKRLRDFISSYNQSDEYMVDSLPHSMRKHLTLLPPVACGDASKRFTDVVLWMSSGGTKSVFHQDSSENIGCLLAGTKTFILFDHKKVQDIDRIIDNPRAFSSMDVDRVDMYKFPEVKDLQPIVANIESGDCIYLPKHWMHHVRSSGRNLAINTWFQTPRSHRVQDDACDINTRTKLTLDQFAFPAADSNRAALGEKKPRYAQVESGGGDEDDDDDDGWDDEMDVMKDEL